MTQLIATKKFKYGLSRLQPGDEFDCRPEHVRVVTLAGLAADAGAQAAPKAPPAKKRGRYRRRDMQAGE